MENLHPGAKWLFRIQTFFGFLFLILIVGIWLGVSLASFVGRLGIIYGIIVALILVIIYAEIYARLAYPRWKFEIGKEGIKIEKGIIWKTYKSIPYTRVQNVDIHRGIIARILGFSTLNIQTAGYSGYARHGRAVGAEGHIPAVSVKRAEEIRALLMKKIGKRQGL